MKAVRKILLTTDFSPSCDRARDYACDIAMKADAELHLLHVHVLHAGNYAWEGVSNLDAHQRELGDAGMATAQDYAKNMDYPVTVAMEREVTAAPAILRYVEQQGIDLIVMGTHARKGIVRLFLGSTSAEVVRQSPTPTLVVGAEHQLEAAGYGSILAPIDFSESSRFSLMQAAQLAHRHEAKLLAVHVINEDLLPPYYTDMFGAPDRDKVRTLLESFVADCHLPVEAELMISSGKPHQRIVELAKELASGLIVIGTAGLAGVERFLVGSTTDRVLRDAPCPVLVHPAELVIDF